MTVVQPRSPRRVPPWWVLAFVMALCAMVATMLWEAGFHLVAVPPYLVACVYFWLAASEMARDRR